MVSFRKSLLLLALIAVFSIAAVAQTTPYPPYQCTANTANPPIARGEGFAEEMGQVQITCYGGVPTARGLLIPTVNVQVFLSTNITSRVLQDPWTEALLIMEEAGAPRINPDGSEFGPALPQVVCGQGSTNFDAILGYCPTRAFNSIGTLDYTGIANPYTVVNPDGSVSNLVEAYIRPNMWQARCLTASCATSAQNQLVWIGVPLNAPGTGPARSMRMVNVRGNANALGVSSTFIPTQINMYISISGTGAPPLTNPNQTVAFVQQGLSFGVEGGRSGLSASNWPYYQCVNPPNPNFEASNVRGCPNLLLRFSENFPTAFRIRRFQNATRDLGGGLTISNYYLNNQNIPGTVYNTESMFFKDTFPDLRGIGRGDLRAGSGSGAGVASNETRLRAVFTNVPANISMYVSRSEVASSIGGVPSVGTSAWYNNLAGNYWNGSTEIWPGLLSGNDPVSGGSLAFYTRSDCGIYDYRRTYYATTSSGATVLWGMNSLSLSLNSTTGLYDGTAIWGIFSNCSNASITLQTNYSQCTGAAQLNNYWMGVSVIYTGQPGLGTMNIAGSYAPTSTVDRWAASGGLGAAVPRFSPNPVGSTNIEIVGCRTNLLYPFITNRGNFDTGIAISNTSRDPFGTQTQTGPCRLYFYGGWTSDPTRSSLQVDTPTDVAPGTSYTFTLSGGVPNATNGDQTRTFQGYLIASCRFQYGHGYAFISDFGTTLFAQGYLALVMDESIGSRTGYFSETLGQ
jgi:hypothetical protein